MKYLRFVFLLFIIGGILCLLNKQLNYLFSDEKIIYQYELSNQNLSEGEKLPSMGRINEDGSVTFERYGTHFIVEAKVNDFNVHFLLDTGASMVTLTRSDAINLGINLENLQYKIKAHTAKGTAFVAPVVFDSIQIGNIVVKNVRGHVAREGLSSSLLGMSFLNRVAKYEISKSGHITFWP